jgi:hypothetical protein
MSNDVQELVAATPAAPAVDAGAVQGWTLIHRIAFRFAFVYLAVYNFPILPQLLWAKLVPWVGDRAFGLDATATVNGSGDQAYHYVQMLCLLALATIVTVIWSLVDRRRGGYPWLDRILRIYLRYVVAASMIGYGSAKIIKTQFPNPFLHRLVRPLGEFSPMGLLWAFMGYSELYNVFTGLVEMVGGLLLTARRTALLGTLLVAGALTNVLMLNLSYDVPVKLYSAHLLLMCGFIIAPDLKRLLDFFILNRPTDAAVRPAIFRNRTLDRTGVALRTLGFACVAFISLQQMYEQRKSWDLAVRGPLHAIWDVEEFTLDGQDLPPLLTDARRWRRVVIEEYGEAGLVNVQRMTGRDEPQRAKLDLENHVIRVFKAEGETSDPPEWAFVLSEPDRLTLEGISRDPNGKEGKFRAKLRRFDERSFLLLNRGFHWINEWPYNQ